MGTPNIVIAGAGSIGCFVGGHLADAGHTVTLLARARVIDQIRANGLGLSDLSGASASVAADQLTLTEVPECFAEADIILVCVKTGATAEMAALILAHAPAGARIISLQNGLLGFETLMVTLPDHDVRAGMVGFNVIPDGQGGYHRATSGNIIIGNGPVNLADILGTPELPFTESDDITATQWGKFLLNLNNAPNALSGLPLYEMMLNRNWRRIMADQLSEALLVLKAAKVTIKPTTPLPAALGPYVLRLPTPLFRRVAARMLTFDPAARSSMSYDLMAGRRTEIEAFQGAIIALGTRNGIATPISLCMRDLIRHAESAKAGLPTLSAAQVAGSD